MTRILCHATTADAMRELGKTVADYVHGGDVIVLSGPLGAGKTTFTQGFAQGLHINEPVVSPTFTIARELHGSDAKNHPITLIHVDAYRLGGINYVPGQNTITQLLDELESLGLDEQLESPDENTIVVMEWGEQMAAALAPERLSIRIARPAESLPESSNLLTSQGVRTVELEAYGTVLQQRLQAWAHQLTEAYPAIEFGIEE